MGRSPCEEEYERLQLLRSTSRCNESSVSGGGGGNCIAATPPGGPLEDADELARPNGLGTAEPGANDIGGAAGANGVPTDAH